MALPPAITRSAGASLSPTSHTVPTAPRGAIYDFNVCPWWVILQIASQESYLITRPGGFFVQQIVQEAISSPMVMAKGFAICGYQMQFLVAGAMSA
jgi:hypothetical protein